MRRVLFILSLFMLVCGYIEARTIIVEIGNGPAEGYALKSCEVKDEEATFKLKLYYPVNQ